MWKNWQIIGKSFMVHISNGAYLVAKKHNLWNWPVIWTILNGRTKISIRGVRSYHYFYHIVRCYDAKMWGQKVSSLCEVLYNYTNTSAAEFSLLPRPQSGTASRKQSVLQHLWPCSESHWKRNYSRDPVPTNILTNCTNTWRLHYWLLIVPWPRSFSYLCRVNDNSLTN